MGEGGKAGCHPLNQYDPATVGNDHDDPARCRCRCVPTCDSTSSLGRTGANACVSAAFSVPLPVLVVNDRDGVRHRGTLKLPSRAPAASGRPSSADLARLRPLMSAHGDALAAQQEGLDPERLSHTYAALMAELQEAAGDRGWAFTRWS